MSHTVTLLQWTRRRRERVTALSSGGFQKNLKGKVIRISPQVKQRKVLSTDPTGDADSRIIEVLVKLDQDSIDTVQNYAGMKVIAKFIP